MSSEFTERLTIPRANYPFLFGGNIPLGFEARHEANQAFAQTLIPPSAEGFSEFDRQIIETCASALTEADHRFGADTSRLGSMCAADEYGNRDGLWNTLPTFYHNGNGTRLAMLGTKQYMDFVNGLEGEHSPYRDRRIYLATMVTAAFDDITFGDFGRGGDEQMSASIAMEYLQSIGAPDEFIAGVYFGIKASTFNENTKQQDYNPAIGKGLFGGLGSEPIQRASLIGDLWALGLPQSTANTFMLMVENLWKRDSGYDASTDIQKRQRYMLLKRAAIQEYFESSQANFANQWQGQQLSDFFAVVQKHHEVRFAFAQELIDNESFLLKVHKYENAGDRRVDAIMLPAKVQNARLQKLLGMAIRDNRMTVNQAFHCALSYADALGWRAGDHGASLGDLTVDNISALLTTTRSFEDISNPVDADQFFAAYAREVGLNRQ